MLTTLAGLLQQAVVITGFVFVMMVVIEYINVLTRGAWDELLRRRRHGQVFFASLLGAIPGCLGSFAAVSLYTHRVITFGAIVATMIATSGDEAFIMLALFPRDALLLFAILFVVGAATGTAADLVLKRHRTSVDQHAVDYRPTHEEEPCRCFSLREFAAQWKGCIPHRGWLTLFLVIYLLGVVTGHTGHHHLGVEELANRAEGPATEHLAEGAYVHGIAEHDGHAHEHGEHDDWNWVRITLLLAVSVGLFIVVTVPDHFLQEHIWHHLVRTHVWRTFLWTLGALVAMHLLVEVLELEELIARGRYPVLAVACLVGLIPQSGPHLFFVTLYAQSAIPFSTLLASSIVQDGHGMIPMLAHSRRAFVAVKLVNLAVGLIVGALGLLMGW